MPIITMRQSTKIILIYCICMFCFYLLFQTDADGHQGDASLVPAPQMVAAAAKNKSPR